MMEEELMDRELYIDEDGIEQEVVEEYNPNVDDEEIENVELDLSMNETFKIDENMPEELKIQLEKFNKHSENLNSIISNSSMQTFDDSENSADDSDDFDDDSDDDDLLEDDILEDDDEAEVGNLF